MNTSTEQLILTELQGLRADVTASQIDMAGRVSALETQTKAVLGNGQPGRLTLVERNVERVEEKIERLGRLKYWAMGFAAAVSALAHYLLPGGKH